MHFMTTERCKILRLSNASWLGACVCVLFKVEKLLVCWLRNWLTILETRRLYFRIYESSKNTEQSPKYVQESKTKLSKNA